MRVRSRLLTPVFSGSPGIAILARLSRLGPLLSVVLLGAITTWVFRRQLFDQWSFPWDFLGTYTTTPAFVAATFGHGHPMSWSPFVASGFPVDVDAQAGAYYPGWWLLGALRIPATLGVLTAVQVLHVLLGAVGVALLARARRLPLIWATIAAVAYLFFGGFYGQAEHADIFRGFAYLPWLLWALTPPAPSSSEGSRRWTRLAAVPVLAWLIVSGAYPGQVVSFAIIGLVYAIVALRAGGQPAWRSHRVALALAVVASGAVCVAVLLPYLRAEQAGELYRTIEPTAALRSMFAISPLDGFGLYLNNFAWTAEGTIMAWAVGVPVLIGLACAGRATLSRHAPLVACGAVAVVLGAAPKIGFIGSAMASVRPLFPSRFPASDYKAAVALALIVISVDAWSRLSTRGRRPVVAVVLTGCVLIGAALLVPSTYAQPTSELWLLIGVTLAAGALALVGPSGRLLAYALVVLVVVDGVREINDYKLRGVVSPWRAPPSELAFYRQRDDYVRALPRLLEQAPASRPARAPDIRPPEPNASGWVADAYHVADYDPTRERALWQAESSPVFSQVLLAPWHAATFPCAMVGCTSGAVHIPPPTRWYVSRDVHTLSYGAAGIVYSVHVSQPTLMIENELAIAGWHANTSRVRSVKSGTPLRAWRLSPGTYDFTASFQERGRALQELMATVALLTWLSCVLVIRRTSATTRSGRQSNDSAA